MTDEPKIRPAMTEADAEAWRDLWPKIAEKVDGDAAVIWCEGRMRHGPERGWHFVVGGHYGSAFGIDTYGEVYRIHAPTLALCLTRAVLALYPEREP